MINPVYLSKPSTPPSDDLITDDALCSSEAKFVIGAGPIPVHPEVLLVEHYQQIEAWSEFADALMNRLDWPETLWEPSPLHVGDLSPFFKQELRIKPVNAVMRVMVEPSHEPVEVVFDIWSNNDGTFNVAVTDTILWKSFDRKLSPESIKKAHDHILKCLQNAAMGVHR